MTDLDITTAAMVPDQTAAVPPDQATGTAMSRRQRITLAVLLTASFTLAVDFSILNVALPTVGADVGFHLDSLQWIATAFSLCAAGFTLLFGRVADLFGRRRLFLIGMAVLGSASLLGGLSVSPPMLLLARICQGLATAAVTPAALSLLTTSFPEGSLRERALGLNGALMAGGFTTGAILGGVLTDMISWRWAFFINVPVAVAVLIVSPTVLTETRPATRPRLDLAGALTVTVALLAIVYGLTRAGASSWTNRGALIPLILGLVLLPIFYAIERRVAAPLVPVHILRLRNVGWGNLAGLLAFATETSLVFLLTLYLQKVLHLSPLAAGLSFAVLGAGTVIGGIIGPRIIASQTSRKAIVLGFALQTLATVSLVLLGADRKWIWLLLVATFIGGVANLVAIVGFMVTATSGLPDYEQGMATGLATMSQQVGITMGIPIMSAIVTGRVHALGGERASTMLSGVTTAIWINGGLCLLTALLIAVFLRAPTRR